MRFRPRMVASVGMTVLVAGALLSPPSSATAGPVTTDSIQALGISFAATGDGGQCTATQPTQWARAGTWSKVIRIDADSRSGGCELNFGIQAASVGFDYQWTPTGNSDGDQCLNDGKHSAVENDPGMFLDEEKIIIDTDGRNGGCYLTFSVASSAWVVDVFYFADGETGQCGGLSTSGTVSAANPVQLLVDTDNRPGGCKLQLRLRNS